MFTITERAVFSKPENVRKYNEGKVVFETYLQEAESINQNKRIYPKHVIQTGMDRVANKVAKRSFLGELDHPITQDQLRQTTVLYKEVSHIIREWSWEGSLLKGVIETTPYTPNGKILSGLVTDGVAVGFSLRGLADVQDMGTHQQVMGPLIMICYDSVSEPSNSKATIQEIKTEQALQVVSESSNMICTSDGVCYMAEYFDDIIHRKLIKLKDKYW